MNPYDSLRRSARRNPAAVAIEAPTAALTYEQLEARAPSMGGALSGLGLSPGDAVGIMLPNVPEFPVALYGAFACGLVVVPMSVHNIVRQHLEWAVGNFEQADAAHSREADERAARALYDERGHAFFRAFLGEPMDFTCANFQDLEDDLERATELSHARICSKLRLGSGQRLLEIGCGWGDFLGYAVSRCGAQAVGVTLSSMQEAFANRRFQRLGVADRARALLADYRDLPQEQFDRIVCLENLERVGAANLRVFFDKLYERLTEQGVVLLQWTGLRRELQPEDLMWGLFINQYVFPGADAGHPPAHRGLADLVKYVVRSELGALLEQRHHRRRDVRQVSPPVRHAGLTEV